MDDIIVLHGLSKYYGSKKALDEVSFSVHKNSLFGLLGVNGAGKTTLIKILCGLAKCDSGTATIDGLSITKDIDKIKSIINISPQESALAPSLSVRENLEFFASIYEKSDKNRIMDIARAFHLDDVLNQRAKTLSGGYQRRLSIAIALVSEPKILFLDEPTLGLDVIARKELWRIIEKLKTKMTIVLTSHYLEEIEALCDDVAILSKGVLLAKGGVESIKKRGNSDSFEDAFVSIVERGKRL